MRWKVTSQSNTLGSGPRRTEARSPFGHRNGRPGGPKQACGNDPTPGGSTLGHGSQDQDAPFGNKCYSRTPSGITASRWHTEAQERQSVLSVGSGREALLRDSQELGALRRSFLRSASASAPRARPASAHYTILHCHYTSEPNDFEVSSVAGSASPLGVRSSAVLSSLMSDLLRPCQEALEQNVGRAS